MTSNEHSNTDGVSPDTSERNTEGERTARNRKHRTKTVVAVIGAALLVMLAAATALNSTALPLWITSEPTSLEDTRVTAAVAADAPGTARLWEEAVTAVNKVVGTPPTWQSQGPFTNPADVCVAGGSVRLSQYLFGDKKTYPPFVECVDLVSAKWDGPTASTPIEVCDLLITQGWLRDGEASYDPTYVEPLDTPSTLDPDSTPPCKVYSSGRELLVGENGDPGSLAIIMTHQSWPAARSGE